MADFNQPVLTSLYTDMVNVLKDRDASALKWLDNTTDTNIPSGAKRWNAANSYFEKFNGTTWSVLAAKYMIDVDKLDGCTVNDLGTSITDLWTASKVTTALSTKLDASVYTAADVLTKIKTVGGATSGLDADLLDGYHAAGTNTPYTIVARDGSGNFSAGTITANLTGVASTATTLTGLTSTVAELNSSAGVTTNIQIQLNGKLGSTATAVDSSKLNGVASDEAATASTIVKRNISGYIYGAAFNSTLADTATAASHYYTETASDGWLRPKTLANTIAEIGGQGYIYKNSAVFNASGSWTCPAGVTRIMIIGAGGGGGGCGACTASSILGYAGGGGGSGSGNIVPSVVVVPATVYTVTIGAGGAGGLVNTDAAYNKIPGVGGISSFGATIFLGGNPGCYNFNKPPTGSGLGGDGGSTEYDPFGLISHTNIIYNKGGSSGQYAGGNGYYSSPTSGGATGVICISGGGGAGVFGAGGNSGIKAAGTAGAANTGAGGGGGSLSDTSIGYAGGAGGSGKIIIYW